MEIFDITQPLHPAIAVYEGDPPFTVESVSRVDASDPDTWNTSRLSLGSHCGTHVDAPRHFCDAAAGVESLPLETLCGPVRVVDLRGSGLPIGPALLADRVGDRPERLLLRTDSEGGIGRAFDPRYAHLTEESAGWLRARGIRLVGIDAPSVEAFDSPGMPVHRCLLLQEPPVVIVEGLDLRGVDPGDFTLFCLPLAVKGGDGAPARAILVRE